MNPVRKTFLKLAALLFAVVLAMSIWHFGAPWKRGLWVAITIALLFGVVPPIGRPFHWLWRRFVDGTTEGVRFFLGVGFVSGLVAAYQTLYVVTAANLQWPPVPGAYRWWAMAGAIGLLCGAIPPLANLLFRGWMALAHIVQAVMSRVILTIVYFVAVLPVGLTAKLVGKRFLDKKLEPERESYWIDRPEVEFEQSRYRRHF